MEKNQLQIFECIKWDNASIIYTELKQVLHLIKWFFIATRKLAENCSFSADVTIYVGLHGSHLRISTLVT